MPLFPGLVEPLSALRLVDQSVAVADPSRLPIEIAGERFAPYVDLRNGRPASGVAGVTWSPSSPATPSHAGRSALVFGANAGQLRLGVLRPLPSVLWLLGSPEAGAPCSRPRTGPASRSSDAARHRPGPPAGTGQHRRGRPRHGQHQPVRELHLVEPAAALDDTAFAFAMHAHPILLQARRHDSLADALAGFDFVVGTASMRDQGWSQETATPRELPQRLAARSIRVALLFGSEVSSLSSEGSRAFSS
ncbi:MAG: hypothetical protein R2862_11695 [Thermoanaerobaculia bacterium]